MVKRVGTDLIKSITTLSKRKSRTIQYAPLARQLFKGVLLFRIKTSGLYPTLLCVALLIAFTTEGGALASSLPETHEGAYRSIWGINSRIAVWMIAQTHLFFAAFVLGVPIFSFCIELVGIITKDKRYDAMAREFIRISMTAFSFTATFGGILLILLVTLYPDFTSYSLKIFGPVMIVYAFLFIVESFALYIYHYGWSAMSDGYLKWLHLFTGLLLNLTGTSIMVLANSWASFMMAPSGVDPETGEFMGNLWAVINGPLWNPLNLHRFVANIAYGGAIVGAYAGFKFLTAKTREGKAHYDWMGHTANLIAVIGLLPLPFAGYWLAKEIYAYSQQMGVTLMGGIFAWVFIIQAVLIGAIFLGVNYYIWVGLGRVSGGEKYRTAIKFMALLLVACFLVWFTPHTIVMTGAEQKTLGGAHHPILGYFGVMSAKNSAVNIMILTTFLSLLLYQRVGKRATASWALQGNAVITALFVAGAINVIALGVYGYLVPANVRIGLSVPQVATTLLVIVMVSVINYGMYKNPDKGRAGPEWGKMPVRSQYALFLIAISFTWLMGLMGYVRSGIRQQWHIYTIMKDNSADSFTPTLGYAAKIVSLNTLLFMAMIVFIFWLDNMGKKRAS